jgi:predicted Zn-dependent peptidase
MATGFVWHELYMWHNTWNWAQVFPPGLTVQPGEHAENPETKRRLRNLVEVSGLLDHLTPIKPRSATEPELARFHTRDYIQRIKALSAENGGEASELTPFGRGSFEIAQLAAGGVMEAFNAVIEGRVANAYALVRPPGHHAIADVGMGFCLFGNAALAILHAQAMHKVGRVAIVDWDVHHGNGTQAAFYQRNDVLTISLHQDNLYPANSGALEERGDGRGAGYNLNIPLPPGSGNGAYVAAFEQVVVPALMRFRPELIVVLSDILADPTFDPDELRREQNVIVQEIGASEDTPDDLIWDRLQETAFAGQPIGRSILGTPATVRSFDSKRLAAYLTRNYRGPDMVIAAAGAVEHHAVVAEVERLFASVTGPRAPPPEPARFVGGSRIERRDLEQVHIALAMDGIPQRDPNLFSLQVFTSVLGGGMSSRLFQEVREQRGLCYAIYAFHAPYSDTGMFGLYAGTDAADVAELMRVVVDEINGAAETLNEAEVARAKAQMKAGLLMALESSSARAEQLARQLLHWGRPIPLDELVGKIEAVTVASARAAGRALIARGRPAVAALGPGNGLESAATIADSLVRRAA